MDMMNEMKEDILHNTIRFNVIGSDLRVMKFLFTNAQLCYLLNNFINDNLVPHSYKYVNIYNPALSIYYKNMNYYVAEGKEKHPAVDINWWGLIKLHLFLEADC